MIVIGSAAMPYRAPKDMDIMVVDMDEPVDASLLKWDLPIDKIQVSQEIYDLLEHTNGFASFNCIYTIKCSHLCINNKWEKTKADVIHFQATGAQLIEPLYHKLVEYWLTINLPQFNLSLNKSKEEFFTDNVTYVLDHDYIHELVAYPAPPMYQSVLADGHEVLISKEKFNALSYEEQVRMFREEITAIAIERWLINPHWEGKISWVRAYVMALKKTIISLTKNWARDFIILNLVDFVRPDFSYFEHAIKILGIENMQGIEVFNEMMAAAGVDEDSREDFISEVLIHGCGCGDMDAMKEAGFEFIEQSGGGEGGTEFCTSIFEWKGQLYSMNYTYTSHHGYYVDDAEYSIKPVTKQTREVTVYE